MHAKLYPDLIAMPRTSQEVIDQINQRLTEVADADAFVPLIHELSALLQLSQGTQVAAGTRLWRATTYHRGLPQNVSDLRYPPAASVKKYGRANRPGRSVFYCSSRPNPALAETRVEPEHFAAVATWVVQVPFIIVYCGFSKDTLLELGGDRDLHDIQSQFQQTLTEDQRKIYDFLARAFMRPDSSAYALTTAIAEVFLDTQGAAGILFPAVSRSGRAGNLALSPEFVRQHLRLERCQFVNINDEAKDLSYGYSSICDLSAVDATGRLSWTYRGEAAPVLPPQSETSFSVAPGDKIRVRGKGGAILRDGEKIYSAPAGSLIESTETGLRVTGPDGSLIEPRSAADYPGPQALVHVPTLSKSERAQAENNPLLDYASILAVSVRARTIRGASVSVASAACVRELDLEPNPWQGKLSEQDAIEFHDPGLLPERIAWWLFIRAAVASAVPTPAVVIVEGDVGSIEAINARTEEIVAAFPLPDGYTLRFAIADPKPSNYVTSVALNACNARADGILARIEQDPSLAAKGTDSDLYAALQMWSKTKA